MSNNDNGTTNFLLFAILCVMLFGSGAVITGLWWAAGIGVVILIVSLVVWGGSAFTRSVRDEVSSAKQRGDGWIWMFFMIPGAIGNFVVCLLALPHWKSGMRLGDALPFVPYYWAPIALMAAGLGVRALETAPQWAPAVPGFLSGLVVGWFQAFIAPATEPLAMWRSIQTAEEPIGRFTAGFALLRGFLHGILRLVIVGLIPLSLVAAVIKTTVLGE